MISHLSAVKLQKLFYVLEKREHVKNSVIFRQGDIIDGIYLISEGELIYQVKQEVHNTDFVKSDWLQPRLQNGGQSKRVDNRTIAQFAVNEIVGFEEFLKSKILTTEKNAWIANQDIIQIKDREIAIERLFTDPTLSHRRYTCKVNSISATVYFLKLQDLNDVYRFIPRKHVVRGVNARDHMLDRQVETIKNIAE